MNDTEKASSGHYHLASRGWFWVVLVASLSVGPMASATPAWTIVAPMSQVRQWHAAAVAKVGLDDRIYVFGGVAVRSVEYYTPLTDTWATLGVADEMSSTLVGNDTGHRTAATFNNKIYLFGGTNSVNPVLEFDPSAAAGSKWTVMSSTGFTTGLDVAATVAKDTGGVDRICVYDGTSPGYFQYFDPAAGGTWTSPNSTNFPAFYGIGQTKVAMACNGITYVFDGGQGIGGYDSLHEEWVDLHDTFVYGNWDTFVATGVGTSNFQYYAAAAGQDGKVYLALDNKDLHAYDIPSGRWDAPQPQSFGVARRGFPLIALKEKLYLIGGEAVGVLPQGTALSSVEMYGDIPDVCSNPMPDGWMQDSLPDLGLEPDVQPGVVMFDSSDIIVRNGPASLNVTNPHSACPRYLPPMIHQDPMFTSIQFIYVTLRNRGLADVTGDLHVYWSSASTGLTWPTNWNNFSVGAVLFGDEVHPSSPIPGIMIPAGQKCVVEVPWSNVPNPLDFSGPDCQHVCLLARFDASAGGDPMSTAEGASVDANTQYNNNSAWKYVSVVSPNGCSRHLVLVRNVQEGEALVELAFQVPQEELTTNGTALFDRCVVGIDLGERLFARWQEGGAVGESVEVIGPSTVRIRRSAAFLGNIFMLPGEQFEVGMTFTYLDVTVEGEEPFTRRLNLVQSSSPLALPGDKRIDGGESYHVVLGGKPSSPFFTQLPHSQSATVGSDVTFTAAADGPSPIAHKWFKGELLVSEQPSLTIVSVSETDAGYYSVVASNAFGEVTSPTVLLKVQPETLVLDPALDFGDMPAAYVACWRYFYYTEEHCFDPPLYYDVKVGSSVPVSYPTMKADNGARHYLWRDSISLGTNQSPTYDGTPSSQAQLDPGYSGGDPFATPVSSTSSGRILNEENGMRRVPEWDLSTPAVVDPRFTIAGKQGWNLFSTGCKKPGEQVFFTVEAYNFYDFTDEAKYCAPFYLNLWIDFGDDILGIDGTPDGKFQPGEHVVEDWPLWGADALQDLSLAGVPYPYDTSDPLIRKAAEGDLCGRDDLGEPLFDELPDIDEQPYANYGLQLIHFPIPAMIVPTCGKKAYARFRITRQKMNLYGTDPSPTNPYGLFNSGGDPDPSVGVVPGGEVEDYLFFMTPNCSSGPFGPSSLCMTLVSQAAVVNHADSGLVDFQVPPACELIPKEPKLLGFSLSLDPIDPTHPTYIDCEYPVEAPVGWCGTGAFLVDIANAGPENLSGVMVTYTLPTNAVFFGANASSDTVTVTQHLDKVDFAIGDLLVGDTVELALHMLPRTKTTGTFTLTHRWEASADQLLLDGSTATYDTKMTIIFSEICSGGVDEDDDGKIDCEDPDCASEAACKKAQFHRGDADDNGRLQLTDAVRILGWLFLGGVPPTCMDAADANDDGSVDLSDPVRILGYLFLGQEAPAAPGPPDGGQPCGADPKAEAPNLGCESYTQC